MGKFSCGRNKNIWDNQGLHDISVVNSPRIGFLAKRGNIIIFYLWGNLLTNYTRWINGNSIEIFYFTEVDGISGLSPSVQLKSSTSKQYGAAATMVIDENLGINLHSWLFKHT